MVDAAAGAAAEVTLGGIDHAERIARWESRTAMIAERLAAIEAMHWERKEGQAKYPPPEPLPHWQPTDANRARDLMGSQVEALGHVLRIERGKVVCGRCYKKRGLKNRQYWLNNPCQQVWAGTAKLRSKPNMGEPRRGRHPEEAKRARMGEFGHELISVDRRPEDAPMETSSGGGGGGRGLGGRADNPPEEQEEQAVVSEKGLQELGSEEKVMDWGFDNPEGELEYEADEDAYMMAQIYDGGGGTDTSLMEGSVQLSEERWRNDDDKSPPAKRYKAGPAEVRKVRLAHEEAGLQGEEGARQDEMAGPSMLGSSSDGQVGASAIAEAARSSGTSVQLGTAAAPVGRATVAGQGGDEDECMEQHGIFDTKPEDAEGSFQQRADTAVEEVSSPVTQANSVDGSRQGGEEEVAQGITARERRIVMTERRAELRRRRAQDVQSLQAAWGDGAVAVSAEAYVELEETAEAPLCVVAAGHEVIVCGGYTGCVR